MSRAHYYVEKETEKSVVLVDVGTGMSITNDAETVVREVQEKGILKGRRLFYYDTMGSLDELLHDGKGVFVGFRTGAALEGKIP